jgi:hypothetical protein
LFQLSAKLSSLSPVNLHFSLYISFSESISPDFI